MESNIPVCPNDQRIIIFFWDTLYKNNFSKAIKCTYLSRYLTFYFLDINALTSKDTLERKQRSKSVQSSRPLDPPPPPPGSPLPPIPVKAPPPAAAAPTAPKATPPPQPPLAPSSLATLPTEKINLQKSGSSAGMYV